MHTRSKRRRDELEETDDPLPKTAKMSKDEIPRGEAQPPRDKSKYIHVKETTGDLFAVEAGSILVHACNCRGSWGAGIAAAFKARYPAAFVIYKKHCDEHGAELLGTTLLIPPQHESANKQERDAGHWIGCLFTSVGKGKKVGRVPSILQATAQAMRDLITQVERHVSDSKQKEIIMGIKMCQINSGLFRVPWLASKEVIEGIEVTQGVTGEIEVVTRADA